MMDIPIPEELLQLKGTKILHISDTPHAINPYIKRLIRKLKPGIIIHTGDMLDDVKLRRYPGKIKSYKKYVMGILDIMKKSGADKVYIVPGNHDIKEYLIEKAPWAEILDDGSVITIEGVKFGLSHAKSRLPEDALYFLYGHGPTGDNWLPQNNVMGRKCYFNGTFSVHVIVLPENKAYYLPYPRKIKYRQCQTGGGILDRISFFITSELQKRRKTVKE